MLWLNRFHCWFTNAFALQAHFGLELLIRRYAFLNRLFHWNISQFFSRLLFLTLLCNYKRFYLALISRKRGRREKKHLVRRRGRRCQSKHNRQRHRNLHHHSHRRSQGWPNTRRSRHHLYLWSFKSPRIIRLFQSRHSSQWLRWRIHHPRLRIIQSWDSTNRSRHHLYQLYYYQRNLGRRRFQR